MKSAFKFCLFAAAAVLVSSLPALAEEASHKSVCIRTMDIDHTEIPDDSTILFYMHHHKVWKNTLISRCVALKNNTRGFTYSPTIPGSNEICSNLFTIRVNDTGETCLPGEFTPVEPAPKG
jgi:hypothetical protein